MTPMWRCKLMRKAADCELWRRGGECSNCEYYGEVVSPKKSGVFTCIAVANQRGSDSPPEPVPVHIECWESVVGRTAYRRIEHAPMFVVNGKWHHSLPAGAKCFLCNEEI